MGLSPPAVECLCTPLGVPPNGGFVVAIHMTCLGQCVAHDLECFSCVAISVNSTMLVLAVAFTLRSEVIFVRRAHKNAHACSRVSIPYLIGPITELCIVSGSSASSANLLELELHIDYSSAASSEIVEATV